MKVKFVGELRSVVLNGEFKRKNGETGYNCNVSVECDGIPEVLPCEKTLFDAFSKGQIKKGNICEFVAEYRPRFKYNQFVVEDLTVKQ